MQLFLTYDSQTWDISPYVVATFKDNILRIFSNGILENIIPAKLGESYYVQVFGQKKSPIITKAKMPENRGDKILWALSFVELEKRVSRPENFFDQLPNLFEEYGSKDSVFHFEKDKYAFFLGKKRPQIGKGSKSRQVKYKPCLAWCSDTISEEDLKVLIQKYRRYRKIYCPIEFLSVL